MNTEGLLSTAEVARLAGRDVSTISRWAAAGDLTVAFRGGGGANGGAMFFRRADVEEFLARAVAS